MAEHGTHRTGLLTRAAIVALAIAAGAVVAAGCGEDDSGEAAGAGSGDGETREIRFAHVSNAESIHQTIAQKFADLVKEKSDGAITVKIFPDAQLGAEDEYLPQVQKGSIEMGYGSTVLANFYKPWGVIDAPYVFANPEQAAETMNGPAGDELRTGLAGVGFHALGTWFGAPRVIETTEDAGPVESLADMKGKKIRAIDAPLPIALFKAWGATPVPIAFDEIYTALQTGTVDGADNSLEFVYVPGTYEVLEHVAMTEHQLTSTTFVMNDDYWSTLAPDDQEILSAAAEEALASGQPQVVEENQRFIDLLKEEGMVFNDVDKEEFKAVADPVVDDFAAENDATDILDGLRSPAGG